MTKKNGTAVAERMAVTTVLARLLVVHNAHNLPMPTDFHAISNGIVDVMVANLDEVQAWIKALGGEDRDVTTHRYAKRGPIHSGYVRGYGGWSVHIVADMPLPEPSPIDDETIAQLTEIAAFLPDMDGNESSGLYDKTTAMPGSPAVPADLYERDDPEDDQPAVSGDEPGYALRGCISDRPVAA